jgi:hypothetical protein
VQSCDGCFLGYCRQYRHELLLLVNHDPGCVSGDRCEYLSALTPHLKTDAISRSFQEPWQSDLFDSCSLY